MCNHEIDRIFIEVKKKEYIYKKKKRKNMETKN